MPGIHTQWQLLMNLECSVQSGGVRVKGMQIALAKLGRVKTGSPQVLLGGPGGQGTRVEVSPDKSRA